MFTNDELMFGQALPKNLIVDPSCKVSNGKGFGGAGL
jgi:hypothetical protein